MSLNKLVNSKPYKLVLAVGLGLLAVALFVQPALAISNPASIAMNNQFVFRNVLETGDWLVYCRYDVNYTTIPSEPANTTYEFVMYNTTGTTILGSRPLNYYQHNIISIYFTKAQASSKGLVWGDPYIVIVRGSPPVFITLTEDVNQDTRVLGAGDYKEQSDLAPHMLAEAEILQADWGIILLENGYLNATGATYFTYAIPAFGSMAPEAMYSTTYYMTVNYTYMNMSETAYEVSLHTQQGARLRLAIQNLASEFGVSEDWMSIWMVAIGYLTFAGVAYSVTKDPGVSMLTGFPVIVGAAWLGVGTSWLTIVIATTIIAAVLFAIHFILARFA